MAEIVTLEEAKAHMRVDFPDDDVLIGMLIAAATEAVLDVASAWDGVGAAPVRLKLAVLTRVSLMFDNRESVEAAAGELPMLTPLRTLEV